MELTYPYGDFVSENVNVVEGELVDAGVYKPLNQGPVHMCTRYSHVLFTLVDSTIICHDGKYAVLMLLMLMA